MAVLFFSHAIIRKTNIHIMNNKLTAKLYKIPEIIFDKYWSAVLSSIVISSASFVLLWLLTQISLIQLPSFYKIPNDDFGRLIYSEFFVKGIEFNFTTYLMTVFCVGLFFAVGNAIIEGWLLWQRS